MRSVHDWLYICLRAVWKSTLARQAEALHLPKNPLTPAVYAGLMQRFIFLLGHCTASFTPRTANLDVGMACVYPRAHQLCSPLFLRSLVPALPASRDHGK